MKTDILIIGAGIAGLTAARELKRRGMACRVLEAEAHVGGRAASFTFPSGAVADSGAHWLHGEENPLRAELDAYGIAYTEEGGDTVIYKNGKKQAADEERWIDSAIDQGKAEAIKRGEALDCALPELAVDAKARERLEAFSFMWNGIEPPLLPSAREFLTDESTPGGVQPTHGIGALSEAMAAEIGWEHIQVNTPAARIVDIGREVRVETKDGVVWSAKKLLFTGSLGVLKSDTVAFEPPLSPTFRQHLAQISMGEMNKIIVQLAPEFLKEKQINASLPMLALKGKRGHFAYLSVGEALLSLFVAGACAREVERMPPEQALEYMKRALAPVAEIQGFSQHIIDAPIITGWVGSPYTRGAYSACLPGGTRSGPRAEGNIIFCGDTFDTRYPAAMAGAYRSGLAAAEMVSGRRA